MAHHSNDRTNIHVRTCSKRSLRNHGGWFSTWILARTGFEEIGAQAALRNTTCPPSRLLARVDMLS